MGRLKLAPWSRLLLCGALSFPALALAGDMPGLHGALETEHRPMQTLRQRPRPLIEWGERFLAPGKMSKGWRLPTGATWRPQLIVFGNLRSAVQTLQAENEITEWVTRLDLHAQLRLSGTERILVSFRPLNDESTHSGYDFSGDTGWNDGMNSDLRAAFFEGDFGEIFPGLDNADRRALDLGFSVGRQPLILQDGLLVDDIVDSFGLSKNSLRPRRTSNLRLTGLWAWGDLDRRPEGSGARVSDEGAQLFAISAGLDLPRTTLEIDLMHVDSEFRGGSGHWLGISGTQRLGKTASTFRVLLSEPTGDEVGLVGSGRVFLSELSWTPKRNHDLIYQTTFFADGRFHSAARDAERGGPLSRAGILFEAPGIGRLPMSLSADATDVYGGSFGWQHFMAKGRRQLVLEVAGRQSTEDSDQGQAGFGLRFQQALLNRYLVQFDGFAAGQNGRSPYFGARLEFQLKF